MRVEVNLLTLLTEMSTIHTQSHTHTHIYIVCVSVCVCVLVCVCVCECECVCACMCDVGCMYSALSQVLEINKTLKKLKQCDTSVSQNTFFFSVLFCFLISITV